MKLGLKYVTNYSNRKLVTKSSTVPDCSSVNNNAATAVPTTYKLYTASSLGIGIIFSTPLYCSRVLHEPQTICKMYQLVHCTKYDSVTVIGSPY